MLASSMATPMGSCPSNHRNLISVRAGFYRTKISRITRTTLMPIRLTHVLPRRLRPAVVRLAEMALSAVGAVPAVRCVGCGELSPLGSSTRGGAPLSRVVFEGSVVVMMILNVFECGRLTCRALRGCPKRQRPARSMT